MVNFILIVRIRLKHFNKKVYGFKKDLKNLFYNKFINKDIYSLYLLLIKYIKLRFGIETIF